VSTLWKTKKTALPYWDGFDKKKRVFKGPLFDLEGLQAALKSGELDLGSDDQCVVATDRCQKELDKLQWTMREVTKALLLLRPTDYVNSQWCDESVPKGATRTPRRYPCDSYGLRILDSADEPWRRHPDAPRYYVKFSVSEEGTLCLVLLQCHLDAYRNY
jgi:hypothetical protein